MTLVELIAQGLGLSQDTTKIRLQQGLNFIHTSSPGLSETVKGVLLSLLYKPTKLVKEIITSEQGRVRGGLTFHHNNDLIRLVKDFSSDSISLSQYRPNNKDFHEISRDQAFVREYLQTRLKLPPAQTYVSLYCIGGEVFKRQLSTLHSSKSQLTTGQEYFKVLDGSSATTKKVAQLEKLKKEISNMDQLQTLEFKMDELQQQAFEKEEVLSKVTAKEEEVADAKKELQGLLQNNQKVAIPDDIRERVEKYKQSFTDRDKELGRLENRAESIMRNLANLPLKPVHKNKPIIFGIIGLLIFTGAAVYFVNLRVPCTIGIVLSIVTAAAGFIQQTTRQEQSRSLKQQLDKLDVEKKAIEKKFEIEMATVTHLMKRLKLTEPEEILELINEREAATEKLKKAKTEMENTRQRLNQTQVTNELNALRQQIQQIQKQMERFSAGNFDPMAVRREIESLEQELGITHSFSQAVISNADEPFVDPLQRLLQSASQLLGIPAGKLLTSIEQGFNTNLLAITSRQFAAAIMENEQIVALSTGKGGQPVMVHDLGQRQMGYVHFALQFTLLQLLAKNGFPFPVIFLDLPDQMADSLTIVQKAINLLSQSIQVIELTSNVGFKALVKPSMTL